MMPPGASNLATVVGETALIGRVVGGKFAIDRLLGDGAMGSVYRAHWAERGIDVALKVLHASVASDPTYTARFKREAKAAARIDHPNSVRIIDSGEEPDGLFFIAMEYVEGRDLHRVLHEDWPLSNEDIADILAQALSAIGYAHEMGVVHRDLKPENLMILPGRGEGDEGRYRVKVCDFGIAKIVDASAPGTDGETSVTDKLTAAGMVLGTPEYMSPEQARGERPEPRSDLYALGIILYQLLTGRTPFEGQAALAIVLQQITKVPEPPRAVYAGVHEGLEAICMKAIAKEPDDRYATASAMRDAVCAVIDVPSARKAVVPALTAAVGSGAGAEPSPDVAPSKPRSRRWLVLSCLAALAALAGGAGYARESLRARFGASPGADTGALRGAGESASGGGGGAGPEGVERTEGVGSRSVGDPGGTDDASDAAAARDAPESLVALSSTESTIEALDAGGSDAAVTDDADGGAADDDDESEADEPTVRHAVKKATKTKQHHAAGKKKKKKKKRR